MIILILLKKKSFFIYFETEIDRYDKIIRLKYEYISYSSDKLSIKIDTCYFTLRYRLSESMSYCLLIIRSDVQVSQSLFPSLIIYFISSNISLINKT